MENNLTLIYLIVGGLVGVTAFAFSNALSVWMERNSVASDARESKPIPLVLARFALIAVLLISLFFMIRAWLPYVKSEHVGLLQGEGLYSVRTVNGFTAEFPNANKEIVEGDLLVSFGRKPNPKERADAMLKRDLLREKISFEELKAPIIDAPTMSLMQSLTRRQNELNARERQLLQQKQMYDRSGKRDESITAGATKRLERDLESLNHRINQQEAATNLTQQELDFAERIASDGLVSKLELSRKREAHRVQTSKLEDLRSQQVFLEESLVVDQTIVEEVSESETYSKITDGWLADIQRERATILEQLDPVEKALAGEEIAANKRLDSSINQLKVELDEVEKTIAGYEDQPSIEVRAPWDGIVGYRDTSPNNIKLAGVPLVVVHKPNSVYVSMRLTSRELDRISGIEDVIVSNKTLEARDLTIKGSILSVEPTTNGMHEVLVTVQPPGYMLADLVDNGTVNMTAKFVNKPVSLAGLINSFTFQDEANSGQSPAIVASIYLFIGMMIL